jgi:hypothetical protein
MTSIAGSSRTSPQRVSEKSERRRAAEQRDEIATPDASCHLTPLAEG